MHDDTMMNDQCHELRKNALRNVAKCSNFVFNDRLSISDFLKHMVNKQENGSLEIEFKRPCRFCTGNNQANFDSKDTITFSSWCNQLNDYYEKELGFKVNRRSERFTSDDARELFGFVSEAEISDYMEHKEVVFQRAYKKFLESKQHPEL